MKIAMSPVLGNHCFLAFLYFYNLYYCTKSSHTVYLFCPLFLQLKIL